MIRVTAASRLHFGLLSLPSEHGGPAVLPARRFGGAGMMVESPGVCLTARPAPAWSAEGPLADRVLAFARRFVATLQPGAIPAQQFRVEHCSAEHAGLGTGTQLGLCVARALASVANWPAADAVDLALRVGRGRRSAIGVWGFDRGGFLVEAGQRQPGSIAPLVARAEVPEDWRVVLVIPPWKSGLSGTGEQGAFMELFQRGIAPERTDKLCRLVLLGMLPALAEADAEAFGEAVYEFNALVGACFAPIQGGVYADPRIAELVDFIRQRGVRGAGQSSWGPAVFAVAPDPDRADDLDRCIREKYGWSAQEVEVVWARNEGARMSHGSGDSS